MSEPPFVPDRDYIRQQCERIQARWTETERRKRLGMIPDLQLGDRRGRRFWTPPLIDTAEVEIPDD